MNMDFSAFDSFSIDVTRDENGSVIVAITADDDTITINTGRTREDAAQLASTLHTASDEATGIEAEWQDIPEEDDGYISDGRLGYYVSAPGKVTGPFPSREIAAYELARIMADGGFFPDVWYQGKQGNTEPAGAEVYAYLDGEDNLRPLPGVKYEEGTRVYISGYDYPYAVDHDYGDLGVMLHISGDPSITEFEQHDALRPASDDCEEG